MLKNIIYFEPPTLQGVHCKRKVLMDKLMGIDGN